MEIKTIMSKAVITAQTDESLRQVCLLMKNNYIGSVIIVEGHVPVGIITERDIVKAVADFGDSIAERAADSVMKTPLLTVSSSTDIHEAGNLMRSNRIRRLPVVSGEQMLAGIVTYGDILKYMKKELAETHTKVRKLEGEVDRDHLTGAFTKKYFELALEKAVARVRDYGGFLSLLMIDIDRFKLVNDTYGHDAGDSLLRDLTALVASDIRDINMLCRYGGDELAVIAPISSLDGGIRMAERLRQTIADTVFYYKDTSFNVTLSIGVAAWHPGMKEPADLIVEADKGLYKAKDEGRNRVGYVNRG